MAMLTRKKIQSVPPPGTGQSQVLLPLVFAIPIKLGLYMPIAKYFIKGIASLRVWLC